MKNNLLIKVFALIYVAGLLCVPVQGTSDWESDMDQSGAISGDMDGNGQVDNKDVEYLLWHTLYPEDFPLPVNGDFDGNNAVDNKDVEYLLWHTLYPEDFPLVKQESTPDEVQLSVNPTTLSLVVGNTSTLTASYNGTGTLSWNSNNTSVATVSNGKVTAKAAGTATITVTDGSKKATCTVTVTAPAQSTETLEINTKNNTTIFVGETLKIDYSYSGDKSKLTWKSSSSSILTVDSNGIVTGKSAGSTVVKVTDGKTTCRVLIIVSDAPKSTSLKGWNYNAALYDGVVKYAGDYMTFKVLAKPDESNPQVIVTSSNKSVVLVSYELDAYNITNVTLNFKSAGSATVTLTSGDGCVSESYKITVKGDYACNPGKSQLTPEEFAYYYNKVVEAHGYTITNCSNYKWLTLSDAELTWVNAREMGETSARTWWHLGKKTVNITYMGINENGKHLFYTYH